MVPFAGFELPIQYAGIKQEHEAVRQRSGLFDVSHMGELIIRGTGALGMVNHLVTNDAARLADGQAMYTCCCNPQGKILDDLIVYRRSSSDILVVCNASNRLKIVSHFSSHANAEATVTDASDETGLLALQGPLALQVLKRADSGAGEAAASLKPFRFLDLQVAGRNTTVARTGYTGEDGVEIFADNADLAAVWDALLDAGAGDTSPAGLGARDTLRLEARLSLYGNDIDETTNPIEGRLGVDGEVQEGGLHRQGGAGRSQSERARAEAGRV